MSEGERIEVFETSLKVESRNSTAYTCITGVITAIVSCISRSQTYTHTHSVKD